MFCIRSLAASDSVLLSSQQSTSSSPTLVQSAELFITTQKTGEGEKQNHYYDFILNVGQNTTPTSYQATPLTVLKLKKYIAPLNTTLIDNTQSLEIDWHSYDSWQIGIGYAGSIQTGSGTPTTQSSTWTLNSGRRLEYGPEAEDSFRASYKWLVTLSSALISAQPFTVTDVTKPNPPYGATGTDAIPGATIGQTSMTLALSWDPLAWLSAGFGYQQFAYDTDPNVLAPVQSPKRGSPTSLESFEDSAELTFHLSDSWDLGVREVYDVTATSDRTASDNETYTLAYSGDTYEIGVGYDHLNMGGVPLDSSVFSFKYLF